MNGLGWCEFDVRLVHNSKSRKARQNSCQTFAAKQQQGEFSGWRIKFMLPTYWGVCSGGFWWERERERERFRFFFGEWPHIYLEFFFFWITLKHNTISPLPSIGRWLHFIMANTACEMLGNSISPDDERSVFNGNKRTEVAGTSLMLKMPISWSSVKPGGVLKKCKIYKNSNRNSLAKD